MADLQDAADAERNARAALVALAGHDDPGDAAGDLDRAIVTLAHEDHPNHLDELLAPAAEPVLQGPVAYRVDHHERGMLEPTEVEELPEVVIAVRRFLEEAEGLGSDESVLLFSAADGVERLVASALADGPVRFHAPEHASISGDQGAAAFASWEAQLDRWAAAKAVPGASTDSDSEGESNGDRRDPRDSAHDADDLTAMRVRIGDLERQLAERDAELSRLRGELDRARDSTVGETGSVRALASRAAHRSLSRYRRSRSGPG